MKPAATAPTTAGDTGVAFTVATPVLPELQVPPAVPSVKLIVEPAQTTTTAFPIAAGLGLTENCRMVEAQDPPKAPAIV